ncbi:MAG: hypothetical protein U9Q81_06935 [Pseudomonadota bacterium]|nr:hypothetical protein [Pseudomonadota bacterium]
MTERNDVFTISDETLNQRNKNILSGAGLSLILCAVLAFGHHRYPETYNDLLFWSVVGFVVIANLVNFLRYRRYSRLVKDHRVEVHPGKVQFWTGGEKSELDPSDIVAVNLFRKKGVLRHIQLRLKNNRGIRLEGYRDLDRLAAMLTEQVPNAHVVDR